MYRNYDGAGGRFGDVSVQASSGDQAQLALYAAERTSDGALDVMVVNKTGTAAHEHGHARRVPAALRGEPLRYSAGRRRPRSCHETDLAVSGGAIGATFPASSITLLVCRVERRGRRRRHADRDAGATPTRTPTPTPTPTRTSPTPTATRTADADATSTPAATATVATRDADGDARRRSRRRRPGRAALDRGRRSATSRAAIPSPACTWTSMVRALAT
jgi:hypothetical protein